MGRDGWSRGRAKLSETHSRCKRRPAMKKSSKLSQQTKLAKPDRSVGLDLGDRFIHYCMLNQEGEVIEEGRMQNSESALCKHFANEAVMRIAMEAGTHSPRS